MTRAAVHFEHRDAHGLVATFRNVVLVVVHDALTIDLLSASVRANRNIAPKHPAGVASLTTVSMGIRFPSAAERAVASEAIAAVRDSVRCAAQHISGDGFWASAARSIVTAIEMIRPDDRPRRTFTSLPDATQWIASCMQEDLNWARELEAVMNELVESTVRRGASPERPV